MDPQGVLTAIGWGTTALVIAAMIAGVVLTRGSVRVMLACALMASLLNMAVTTLAPGQAIIADTSLMIAFTALTAALYVAQFGFLVAAAVIGARTVKAKDARIAALTDAPSATWSQPETSPDPHLLAE